MSSGEQLHFMPHGMCYLWNPAMLLLQIASEAGIAVAYFSIPIALFYFLRKRRDVPFGGTIAMFGAFIVACGLTHVMGIWTIWHPAFWLDGSLKALTATISLTTAVMLVPLIPKALLLRTPAELERVNAKLLADIELRHEALVESEQRYHSFAEAMPQIVWTADVHGEIDYYNHRWSEYTGYTLEESLGRGWEPVLHPDDLAAVSENWGRALREGTPYEAEFRLKRAGSEGYGWHLGRAVPGRDAGGAITKWFGTCVDIDELKTALEAAGRFSESTRVNEQLQRDITARKQAEAALRASEKLYRQVEEHAPIGLALVDLEGRFLRVNPALRELTEYGEAQLLAMTFQELTHPEDLGLDLDFMQKSLAGTISHYQMQKRYIMNNDRTVWVQLNCSLVRDDSDRPLYFIRQTQDITNWKAAEETVKAAQRAALAAADAKSRFLAAMSHEIRTPMNGIIGMTELLLFSKLSAQQNEYVKIVRDSGRSLLRVLNDILDYSKIEAGKLALEIVDFEPRSEIRSIVSLLEPQFKAKRVALTTHIGESVPVAVEGDPGRIRQILVNLIGNALKFTPAQGHVGIAVAIEAPSGDLGMIRFTVTDTGPGIAPEAKARLFQPFSQLDESTTRKYGGTGLGLSICKQLVEIMGGTIGVESTVGAGSSFSFAVPCRTAATRRRPLEPEGAVNERRGPAAFRRERILLAEDNEINTLLSIRQFERLGFRISVVRNGREALAAVEHESFDAVFMDCHMPEMDGLDATRAIRKLANDEKRDIPIIAMTADAQAEDEQACLAAGMDDYLSKPVSLADLRRATARWLPAAPLGLNEAAGA